MAVNIWDGAGVAKMPSDLGAECARGLKDMPRLLYSSDTNRCNAAIELGSEEICVVSINNNGVLVRAYVRGIAVDGSGGQGITLYKENSSYRIAKTAQVLNRIYQTQPELEFPNPVLRAICNAIWNCADAAEAAIVINEAVMI